MNRILLVSSLVLLFGFLGVLAGPANAQSKYPTDAPRTNKPPVSSAIDVKLAAPEISAVYILAPNGEAATVVSGSGLHFQLGLTGGPPTHFRLSTVNGFPGADWKAVPSTSGFLYELPSSARIDGPKTFYVQAMNDAGKSQVVSTPFEYRTLRPDLDPSVTQSSATVYPGQNVTYTVMVQNSGEAAAAAVTADNDLPDGFDYISHMPSAGFACEHQSSQNKLRCTGGLIEAGQAATISIVTKLALSAQAGHQLFFGVTADPENQIAESSETNNTAGAVATTVEAPLVEQVVPGALAMMLAKENGYEFRASDVQGPSSNPCRILVNQGKFDLTLHPKTPPFLWTIDDSAGAARCRYEFFAEKSLRGPWKLTNVEVSVNGGDMTWITAPAVQTDNPHFTLEVANQEGNSIAHGRIDSITLSAPQNHHDWRDAFRD